MELSMDRKEIAWAWQKKMAKLRNDFPRILTDGNELSEERMHDFMQRFTWVDYVVFVLMLAISAVVGVYWGFLRKQTTQQDYLLGGRNMKVLPVAMSLVASFVSGVTLLGSPTEVYMYGTQYAFIMIGIFLMSFVMMQVYLPVFHNLKITSNYEYLSLRFDNKVRLFGSILFTFTLIGWLPIVIYVPALAFNQVTGVNIHVITPIVCLVCVFYTSAGGLRAVVWTDVIQITVMFGAMALVAIKGTADVGGFLHVIKVNMQTGRIEKPNFDFDPTTRHTFWCLAFGGMVYWLQANAVNQSMIQRYLAIPKLENAKWAVVLFCIGMSLIYCFCIYCGLLIYATYHDCDPLQTKMAKEKDQLLPLLVMEVLGKVPGLSGVFIAGIFSAALSSLSTSLNSMSAVVLEDFYKPFFKKELSMTESVWLMRSVVVLLGALCLGLVFVVEKLGTILQLTMTLEAMTMGPQLGVFTMGILMPWVDSMGALIGGLVGLGTMSFWCLSAQFAIARGDIVHQHKPLMVDDCIPFLTSDERINGTHGYSIVHPIKSNPDVNPILQVSYMWYTAAGALITIIVGSSLSSILRCVRKGTYVPPAPNLLAPQIRKFYKDPPHPTEERFIRAYSSNSNEYETICQSVAMKPIKETEERTVALKMNEV